MCIYVYNVICIPILRIHIMFCMYIFLYVGAAVASSCELSLTSIKYFQYQYHYYYYYYAYYHEYHYMLLSLLLLLLLLLFYVLLRYSEIAYTIRPCTTYTHGIEITQRCMRISSVAVSVRVHLHILCSSTFRCYVA